MSIDIAENYENTEQFDKAYLEFKKVLQKKPKNPDILERLAHLAMVLNKKDEAQEFYMRLLELDNANIMAYEQLMDICFNTDKYKYYMYRGNLHVCQHQLSHAVNDFKKALEKASENQQRLAMHFMLATLYEQLNKPYQAIDEYLRIIDSDRTNKTVYFKLVDLYESLDTLSSAISILELAKKNGLADNEINEMLAKLYLKNDEPSKAKELTKDVLIKAESLMADNKEDEALQLLKTVEAEYKKNPDYHLLIAKYYFQKQKFEKALESVNEFDKFKKNSPLTYQMRALIYTEAGDEYLEHINWAKFNLLRDNKDVALNEYMLAHRLKEDDAELVATLANLFDSVNDKNNAMEFYEKLFQLEPNNKKALEKLAWFRSNFGDYKMVVEYLERLFELDKRNINTIKQLAVAYERTKDLSKALEFYNKYLLLSSNATDVEEIKKKIKKLEGKTYSQAESDGGGLIDWIMKFFNK